MRVYDINLHIRGKKNYLKKRVETKLEHILKVVFFISIILFAIYLIAFIGVNARKNQFNKEYKSMVSNNQTKRLKEYEKSKILFILNRAKKRIILDNVIEIIYEDKPSFFRVRSLNTQNKNGTLVFKVEYMVYIRNGNRADSMKELIKDRIENNRYGLDIKDTTIQKVSILDNNSLKLNISGSVKIYE